MTYLPIFLSLPVCSAICLHFVFVSQEDVGDPGDLGSPCSPQPVGRIWTVSQRGSRPLPASPPPAYCASYAGHALLFSQLQLAGEVLIFNEETRHDPALPDRNSACP